MQSTQLGIIAATVFLLAACGGESTGPGGNGPPPPPANQRPTANLSVTPSSGAPPLEVSISLACTDSDGTVSEYRVDADGDGSYEITQASAIEVSRTYASDATIGGQCVDDNGAESAVATRSVDVILPALILHLRNLTQDGEPFVRGEGMITFSVGAEEFTSMDSVVVEVSPGSYDIWAEHADYYSTWGLIKRDDQPKFAHLVHRDVQTTISAVSVGEGQTLRLFIYKIPLEVDMAVAADIFDRPDDPPQGTDRFGNRELVIWLNTEVSDGTDQRTIASINQWRTSEGNDGVQALTDGFFGVADYREGSAVPSDQYIEIWLTNDPQFFCGEHREVVSGNRITSGLVRLKLGFSFLPGNRCLLEELGQVLGLRSDPDNTLGVNFNEVAVTSGQYNDFGLALGKILYWFPPGTHFWQGN